MKNKISEKEEACTLIEDTHSTIKRFIGDFVKYHTGKGHIEIDNKSANFVLTMRLERKKEVKKDETKTG